MRLEVLVYPQRVQRGGIKTGQEHVDHNHQVQLTLFQALRQILVVVLELVCRGVEAGGEQRVVILDRGLQKIPRAGIQAFGFELLITE
ncbi:hypothetical protein D3C78_1243550 [compost metagenome]